MLKQFLKFGNICGTCGKTQFPKVLLRTNPREITMPTSSQTYTSAHTHPRRSLAHPECRPLSTWWQHWSMAFHGQIFWELAQGFSKQTELHCLGHGVSVWVPLQVEPEARVWRYMAYLGGESENGEDVHRGVLTNKSLLRALDLGPSREWRETMWNTPRSCPS